MSFSYSDTMNALSPERFELGFRDWKTYGTSVAVKIGMGPSTCWLEVTLTPADLYDVSVFKIRNSTRMVQFTLDGIHAEALAPAVVRSWCELCSTKGW